MARNKSATSSDLAGPSAAQLQTQLDALDKQLSEIDAANGTYQAEKAGLTTPAYVDGDTAARERLDELNLALAQSEGRRSDIIAARGPLQEQHDATQARELAAANAAEIERLEEKVPKAHEAAEQTAEAILEGARQLRHLVADHETAIATYTRLRRRLAELEGEDPPRGLGNLAPMELSVLVVDAIGLPAVMSPVEVYQLQERAQAEAIRSFNTGMGQGRQAAERERTDPDRRFESAVDQRRREIFG